MGATTTMMQAGRRCRHGAWSGACFAALLLAAGSARTAPLDLEDSTPRPIEVRFEISPADQPGRLDSAWSAPRLGVLEPSLNPDQVRIRIPAQEMEDHLTSAGTSVIPGTFSDFVWTIDRVSGHVVHAELAGRIHERLAIGLLVTRIAVEIRVDMSTERQGGFRTSRGMFGIETHDFCNAPDTLERCVPVETRRFDPTRGYVNAIGDIRAATPLAEVRAFSPLGEIRFSERAAEEIGSRTQTTREHDAVFSPAMVPDGGAERGG